MPTVAARSHVTLLQTLMRQRGLTRERTIDVFTRRAAQMGVSDFALSLRQLDRWLAGEIGTRPRPSVCRVVEAEFGRPIEDLLAAADDDIEAGSTANGPEGEVLRTGELIAWLADHSNTDFVDLWPAVAACAAACRSVPHRQRAGMEHRRSTVRRDDIARAVDRYYGSPEELYRATVDGEELLLTVLAASRWTGLSMPLGRDTEHVRVVNSELGDPMLSETGVRAAVRRLAAVEVSETVMVNDLVYALTDVDIGARDMTASFRPVDFAAYALTSDLLEEELVDAITSEGQAGTPLRDLYLPSVDRALDLAGRICVGGPACLTAVARPQGDYALLVQQRSSRVVNVAGRLAVIPKAFHQPMVDTLAEARLSTTVERELEEELLGRLDLDQIAAETGKRIAPQHDLSISEPMAWLRSNSSAWRLELTGFGINLVSGNYEFACLIVIHDPTWWERYGHLVEANWEAARLRCWSSRDTDGLTQLVTDPKWSNEGLFAFIEGMRRLASINDDRVNVPRIDTSVA